MSYTLANNDQFKTHPLYKDQPVNENLPNWKAYRLSKAPMSSIHSQSSHWRATCNYNSAGVVLANYVRSSFGNVDLITLNGQGCMKMEYVNIRGKGCKECTIWCNQRDGFTFIISNWFGQFGFRDNKCSYKNAAGSIKYERSFVRTALKTVVTAVLLVGHRQLSTGLDLVYCKVLNSEQNYT